MAFTAKDLAINGGPRAKTSETPPMFPGGLEIGEEEKREVLESSIASTFSATTGRKSTRPR